MVKLTVEIVERAYQYTNAIADRELDLRGYKAPAIENFGSTQDQFDTIDLSDNEIRKLDGFPLLKRLKNIILTDNKIVRIAIDLSLQLPNLETLILTGNNLTELKDLDPLALCSKLDFLNLSQCPVTLKQNYRFYVVYRIPSLRFLDYRRVTKEERDIGRSLFKHLPPVSQTPKLAPTPIPRTAVPVVSGLENVVKTFTPGAPLNADDKTAAAAAIVMATGIMPPKSFTSDETNRSAIVKKPNQEELVVPHGDKENQSLATGASVDLDLLAETTKRPDMDDTSGEMGVLNGGGVSLPMAGQKRPAGPSNQDLLALHDAIKRAKTMDEVERLQLLLTSGQFTGFSGQSAT